MKFLVTRFLDNWRVVCEKYNFPLNKTFNMDESGTTIVANKVSKMTAGKAKKTRGQQPANRG
jgi:hypothetical protein